MSVRLIIHTRCPTNLRTPGRRSAEYTAFSSIWTITWLEADSDAARVSFSMRASCLRSESVKSKRCGTWIESWRNCSIWFRRIRTLPSHRITESYLGRTGISAMGRSTMRKSSKSRLWKASSAEGPQLIGGGGRIEHREFWRGVVLLLIVTFSLIHLKAHAHRVQLAYIGPGAGFVFVGSFLSILFGFLAAVLSSLIWPFRMLWRFATRRHSLRRAHVRKLIFLGMDGLDPKLVEKFMEQG